MSTSKSRTTVTDGSGFYGVLKLAPGDYRVTVDGRRDAREFRVQAGAVSRVDLDGREPLPIPIATQ